MSYELLLALYGLCYQFKSCVLFYDLRDVCKLLCNKSIAQCNCSSIMKVTITTLTGDKHELEVAPQDTVKHLKVSVLPRLCQKITIYIKLKVMYTSFQSQLAIGQTTELATSQ